MNKRIERLIKKIYNSTFKKIFNNDNIKIFSKKGNKHKVEEYIKKLKNSDQFDKFSKKFAKKISQSIPISVKNEWKQDYNKSENKKNYSNFKEFEIEMMKLIIEQNFTLIKTIPDEIMKMYQNKYIDVLIDQVALGKIGRNSFKNELLKHGSTNANVIARTETSKLQSYIEENKARRLGSVIYKWRSNNDPRTRPSHRNMNNVIVFWRGQNEKPLLDNMRGNAGEFPNCRCSSSAIFDEFDLKENNYKVYNYKTDKIVNMTKKELLYYMKKGKL